MAAKDVLRVSLEAGAKKFTPWLRYVLVSTSKEIDILILGTEKWRKYADAGDGLIA